MTPRRTADLRRYLRGSWRILLKELSAFGLVGALSFVIDLGLFALLQKHGALKANCVSTVVSTAFAYVGNRHLSFSHRARTSLARETTFFFAINLIALIFSELVIALFVYGFGYDHGGRTVLVVKIVTIGIGTVFRFWAYKRFVFLHPDKVHAPPTEIDLESELSE
jgi:putative flippase GtrA